MLAVLQPVKEGRLIPVDRAVVLVGRSSECDVIVSTSKKMSRKHCCLVQADDEYYVRDLDSMNGVWVNGQRVDKLARIQAGDKVSIGDVEYLFHTNVRVTSKKSTPDAVPLADASQQNPVILDENEDTLQTQANDGSFDDVIDLSDDRVPNSGAERDNEFVLVEEVSEASDEFQIEFEDDELLKFGQSDARTPPSELPAADDPIINLRDSNPGDSDDDIFVLDFGDDDD